ncbi:TetR/AcrR family transcriptional regulator [Microbacterium sp. JZ37]|uniref:TetR/AcrR family transcriptional regulator n=1 Tax=Microbacterium sp. JZ37 TaxID=2654193 RepID=UPI002B46F440|nr:TetR/AcrR family transcriptional regulator [Microbacterium sp. JZ37]WRH16170.1 TetR family transcriptional regulator [Microbacterium sp. JZ37]
MSTRDRIVDAAATVMRDLGVVKSTTKAIARAAGCSEALLYKHFPSKQELFAAVLRERLPQPLADVRPGEGDLRENLERAVVALLAFYEAGFPIAAALFGDRETLAGWRAQSEARGGGPEAPRRLVAEYLRAEQRLGRVAPARDVDAVASLLTGAALHEAFVASFAGRPIPDPDELARSWVAALGW